MSNAYLQPLDYFFGALAMQVAFTVAMPRTGQIFRRIQYSSLHERVRHTAQRREQRGL